MAVRITEIIPVQGFEVITRFLASQLLEEIDNQFTLQGLTETFKVFLEKGSAVDLRETDIVYNVLFGSAEMESHTFTDSMYIGTWFIDIYAKGVHQPTQEGDEYTALILLKHIGMVRYIFDSAKSQLLTTNEKLRLTGMVKSFGTVEPHSNKDANFLKMGRLSLEIKFRESQDIFSGVAFGENHTQIKISDSEDGYQLILK